MVGEFSLAGGAGRLGRAQGKVARGMGTLIFPRCQKNTLALVEALLNSPSSDSDRVCCLFGKGREAETIIAQLFVMIN